MKPITAIFLTAFVFVGFVQANEQTGTDIRPLKKTEVIRTNSFKECAAVSMWAVSPKELNKLVDSGLANRPDDNDLLDAVVKIPEGWSVVGTSSNGISAGPGRPGLWLFICR